MKYSWHAILAMSLVSVNYLAYKAYINKDWYLNCTVTERHDAKQMVDLRCFVNQ